MYIYFLEKNMRGFFKNRLNIAALAAIGVAVVVAMIAVALTYGAALFTFSPDVYYESYCADTSEDSSTHSEVTSSKPSVSSEPEQLPEPEVQLELSSPTKKDVTVNGSEFSITGTSDPKHPLLMNGKEVSRLESGEFSIDVTLKAGKNTFKFEHKGKKETYIVRYNFRVIKSCYPGKKQKYEAGASFVAVVVARADCSSVKAKFNGKTISLTPASNEKGDEFIKYSGSFALPKGNSRDKNLGGVTFTAVSNGVKQSVTSASVVCQRDKTAAGTHVVQIVASQAETFNGNSTDDWSRPTNSYLPKGTVDYKVGNIVYEPESGNSYYKLRCGKRVYITKKNSPEKNRVTVSKVYKAKLPKYNTIDFSSFETVGKHSVLTIKTKWKAPFAVKLAPQQYDNPAKQDYEISKATYKYIDIKFFYTKKLEKLSIPKNHPIFSSSKVIADSDGYTLRLYLKKTGEFYGWNAEYDKSGQLVFKFLNPPKITKKNNLSGIKIVIDAGHGGVDIGAPGLRPKTMCEAERNLSLAYKLKKELEKYGAMVVMSRTGDTSLSADARCEFLRREAPDLCISIHHDSSTRASASGGSIFCFNAFSKMATDLVAKHIRAGEYYSRIIEGWHYFYLARVTSCPVVLTENGFISNPNDFKGIRNDAVNTRKAKSIAKGVLEYFNGFYKNVANDEELPYNDTDKTDNDASSGESEVSKPSLDGGESTPSENTGSENSSSSAIDSDVDDNLPSKPDGDKPDNNEPLGSTPSSEMEVPSLPEVSSEEESVLPEPPSSDENSEGGNDEESSDQNNRGDESVSSDVGENAEETTSENESVSDDCSQDAVS